MWKDANSTKLFRSTMAIAAYIPTDHPKTKEIFPGHFGELRSFSNQPHRALPAAQCFKSMKDRGSNSTSDADQQQSIFDRIRAQFFLRTKVDGGRSPLSEVHFDAAAA
jgi:hypothetical protein